MRETRLLMGMPITVDIVGATDHAVLSRRSSPISNGVDRRFSTYKTDSEIAAINRAGSAEADYSDEMREVLALAERTRRETDGFFDIRRPDGSLDPSGIVKGWAIRNAAAMVAATRRPRLSSSTPAATSSRPATMPTAKPWSVGIRNPFDATEIIKVVYPRGKGVATSGTYVRGQHIYNPQRPTGPIDRHRQPDGHRPRRARGRPLRHRRLRHGPRRHRLHRTDARASKAMPSTASGRATLTSGFGDYCAP